MAPLADETRFDPIQEYVAAALEMSSRPTVSPAESLAELQRVQLGQLTLAGRIEHDGLMTSLSW